MNTLIVLDISGLICIKCQDGIAISPYYSIKPIEGYKEFVDRLLELGYDIAWFSSTSHKNAIKILKALDMYDKPSTFKWFNAGKTKDLKMVKSSFPLYSKYIIIDDSPEKIMCNNEDERIIF